jgi:hypothetical protein
MLGEIFCVWKRKLVISHQSYQFRLHWNNIVGRRQCRLPTILLVGRRQCRLLILAANNFDTAGFDMKSKINFLLEQAGEPVPQRVSFFCGWFLVGWAREPTPCLNLGVGFSR